MPTETSTGAIRLLAVVGPTASGKTALAVGLAQALDGEVISADSMQLYAEPMIGTARPTRQEQGGVPHHLMGFLPLSQPYSVAQYAADARAAIADIVARDHLPILCGGTGLYVQAVVENLSFSPQETGSPLRAQLKERAAQEGSQALYEELQGIDPQTAERLHPHDEGRIIRALEVYFLTGHTMTQQRVLSREQPSPYDHTFIRLDFRDRAQLYRRIDRRVDKMLEAGLVEEARRLLAAPEAPTAMQAIGYKELAPYLAGECSLEEAVAGLKQSTRRYAKRQLSWFRRLPEAITLYVDDYADAAALTAAALQRLKKEECP